LHHHLDPLDRLIIATALAHEAQLASLDDKFPLYEEIADDRLLAERTGLSAVEVRRLREGNGSG
jgi:predicted nucleic acid-binding protein